MRLTSLVLPQQVKIRSGGYLNLSNCREELGKRNFGFDSLKSRLNRDMEEKGTVRPELSCWTPGVELPDGHRSSDGSPPAPAGESVPARQSHLVLNLPASEMRNHLRPTLVRWSTKSYLCSDWRGMGKWGVICKCACFLHRGRRRNSLFYFSPPFHLSLFRSLSFSPSIDVHHDQV